MYKPKPLLPTKTIFSSVDAILWGQRYLAQDNVTKKHRFSRIILGIINIFIIYSKSMYKMQRYKLYTSSCPDITMQVHFVTLQLIQFFLVTLLTSSKYYLFTLLTLTLSLILYLTLIT